MPNAQIEKINATDPMLREVNRGLMVSWINYGLPERAWGDVRTSIVLYDEDKLFETALPKGLTEPEIAAYAAHSPKIRYWSVGIV